MLNPRRIVGDAIVLQDPVLHDHVSELSLAVRDRSGAPERVQVRELGKHFRGLEDVELELLHVARLRTTFGEHGMPRVYGGYGEQGRLLALVEENPGDVALRSLTAKLDERNAMLVAIHVALALSDLAVAAEELDPELCFAIEPDDVRIRIDGTPRFQASPVPGWKSMQHGAAAGLMPIPYEWMAPERLRGLHATPRALMYAAGILMFEAIAGKHPFKADARGSRSMLEVISRMATTDVPDLATARAGVPNDVARIVHRCTRRNPEERYATWTELRAELEEVEHIHGLLEHEDVARMTLRAAPQELANAIAVERGLAQLDLDALFATLPREPLEKIEIEPLAHLSYRREP